jgi:hypothetical protein
MNPNDSWATDNASGDHGDVTFAGSGYPICELTYMMANAGLKNGGTAVAELNYDQRRTLASFLTYILSEPAQAKLSTSYFQQLPSTIVATLRGGVQANAERKRTFRIISSSPDERRKLSFYCGFGDVSVASSCGRRRTGAWPLTPSTSGFSQGTTPSR